MAEAFDSGFDLLPADGPDVATDSLLAEALGVLPDALVEDATPLPLGRGWDFDFASGQFHRRGSSPVPVYGVDNLRVWVEKTLRTARLAHTIYTDQYGMEFVEIIGFAFDPVRAGAYATAVTQALVVHDHIDAVRDFKFSHDPDADPEALFVSFSVVRNSGDVVPIGPLNVGGI